MTCALTLLVDALALLIGYAIVSRRLARGGIVDVRIITRVPLAVEAGRALNRGEVSNMTYRQALLFAVLTGVGIFVGVAAGGSSSAASVIPYAIGSAMAVALALCALVAYSNGQLNKR